MQAVAASRSLGGPKTQHVSATAPKNKQSAGARSQQQAPTHAPPHSRNFIAENIRSLQVRVKDKIDIADDEDTGLALAEIAKRRASAIRARRDEHEHERGLVPPKHSRNFILENVNNIAKLARKISLSKQNKPKQHPLFGNNRGPSRRKVKEKEGQRKTTETPTVKLMRLGRQRDRSEIRRGAVLKEIANELAKSGINTGGLGEAHPSRRRRRRRRRPPPEPNTRAKNKKAK